MSITTDYVQTAIQISSMLNITYLDAYNLMLRMKAEVYLSPLSWEDALRHALSVMAYGVWDFDNWKKSL